MHNSGMGTVVTGGVTFSPNWSGPCSILPVLCPGEGNSGRQRRPGTSLSPGPGADGRGQNVVPQERLGRCEICETRSEQPPGSVLLLSRSCFQRLQGFRRRVCFVNPVTFPCLSAFISVQVLEAHGLRPISLKPKEVASEGSHAVKYLSCLRVTWSTLCVLRFRG